MLALIHKVPVLILRQLSNVFFPLYFTCIDWFSRSAVIKHFGVQVVDDFVHQWWLGFLRVK